MVTGDETEQNDNKTKDPDHFSLYLQYLQILSFRLRWVRTSNASLASLSLLNLIGHGNVVAYLNTYRMTCRCRKLLVRPFFFNLCNEIEIRKFGITDWDVNLIEL